MSKKKPGKARAKAPAKAKTKKAPEPKEKGEAALIEPASTTEERLGEKIEESRDEAKLGVAEAPESAEAAEAKPEEVEEATVEEETEEEELEIVEEKFYDLNLRRIWNVPREKRTPRAVRFLRDYVASRMKTDEVSLSEEANSMLWKRGISKPPRRIRVRAVKDKDGRVIVFPGEGK